MAMSLGFFMASVGHGAILTGTGQGVIDGKTVSAMVEFDLTGDGDLLITLTNTSTHDDFAMAHVLTGIAFDLDGVDFAIGDETRSKVVVASGSYLSGQSAGYPSYPALTDVSQEWGFVRGLSVDDVNDVLLGPFDFTATATAPISGSYAGQFAAGDFPLESRSEGLDGGDFGLINNWASRVYDGIKSASVILDAVQITLQPGDGPLSASDVQRIRNASFTYGSAETGLVCVPDQVIPEASTFVVWSILGVVAVTIRRWRRQRTA